MKSRARFLTVNGRKLRTFRLTRGWTQAQLAKSSGYSERLVRKAEKGGTLDLETIQNIAEALSTPEAPISTESLTLDMIAIARKWMECWEQHETRMVPEVKALLDEEFEFVCPGEPGTAPFIGTFRGTEGLQRWLDLYFSVVQRQKCGEIEYLIGENSVIARWLECGTFLGVPSPPIRINLYFQFADGLIAKIVDDYDTHTGAVIASTAQAKRCEDNTPPNQTQSEPEQ
ncbi:MAG: helix-turn-helix domain-containing protein [Planctomycetaceae bacterium]